MNLIQAATMKKISPRSTTNKRKKRTSPKGILLPILAYFLVIVGRHMLYFQEENITCFIFL
jgi:hypothetical protein